MFGRRLLELDGVAEVGKPHHTCLAAEFADQANESVVAGQTEQFEVKISVCSEIVREAAVGCG